MTTRLHCPAQAAARGRRRTPGRSRPSSRGISAVSADEAVLTWCLLCTGHGSQEPDASGEETSGYNDTILPCDFKRAGQISESPHCCASAGISVGATNSMPIMRHAHQGTLK